jgi:glycosyltransferase involved in cell wall biosynthesis
LHTFVICAYGASSYLQECVDSLLAQNTKTNIVVATSTANDTIRHICDEHNFKLFINNESKGIGSDWNFALSKVETPMATIAHQDDIYCPNYATRCIEKFETSQKPLLFFTGYGEIRGDELVDSNKILEVKKRMLKPLESAKGASSIKKRRRILSLGSAISCPSVSFYLPNLKQPIFSTKMKCSLDWQAWSDIALQSGDFLYAPEVLMYHRIHEGSATSNLIADNTRSTEDLAILKQYWPSPIAKLINSVYSSAQSSNSNNQ